RKRMERVRQARLAKQATAGGTEPVAAHAATVATGIEPAPKGQGEQKGEGEGQGEGKGKGENKGDSAVAAAAALPVDQSEAEKESGRGVALGNKVLAAAGIDPACWVGSFALVSAWLAASFDPDLDIIPAVQAVAKRPGYAPLASLAYFTRPIEKAWRERT